MESSVVEKPESGKAASSFTKSLLLGEIHEEMVFPWPQPDAEEQIKVRELCARAREIGDSIDHRKVEEDRWIGDDVIRELGDAGLCGLYVDEKYGGQGLSQTGYARVFETFAQIDGTLSIILGVHQSIGYKGIVLFGTDEQKERFLPDLATGRKLAGFALTEPEAGSDAYNLQSRAVLQPDGSWVLNGEKRYIGNGSKGDVFTAFARAEVGGKDRHIALILEKGMEGFEVGERFDTMGLRGNDLRRLYFNDVRVPPENVLGEPGEGFRIAMSVLNNGRIGLGTGTVGAAKKLLDLTIEHTKERRQFGQSLAEFELVQEKVGWMVSYLFGLESMAYLTCGLVDQGVEDYSLESAICKVSGTEFLWYAANRALQLRGGEGYMKDRALREDHAGHPDLPDLRGRQRRDEGVHRALGDEAGRRAPLRARRDRPQRPDPLDRRPRRLRRGPRQARGPPGEDLDGPPRAFGPRRCGRRPGQGARLRDRGADPQAQDRTWHLRQLDQKRLSDAISDVYAQVAVLSRVTAIFEEDGVEPSGSGALHRRHVLRPGRRAGSAATSSRSRTTTTTG